MALANSVVVKVISSSAISVNLTNYMIFTNRSTESLVEGELAVSETILGDFAAECTSERSCHFKKVETTSGWHTQNAGQAIGNHQDVPTWAAQGKYGGVKR